MAARQHRENPGLVERIISLGKPVFVSVPHDYPAGGLRLADNVVPLYCIVKYPTLLEEVIVPDFRSSVFKGLSDHSLGLGASLLAVARGAKYVEKHFTLDNALQRSNEKAHLGAMTVEDLVNLRRFSRQIERILEVESRDELSVGEPTM